MTPQLSTKPTTLIRLQLSTKAYDTLCSMGDVPRQHLGAQARGIGWYASQLLLTTTSFADTRPDWLQQMAVDPWNSKNFRYWVMHGKPRIPRDMKLSPAAINAGIEHMLALDIRPGHTTPAAYVGGLLELIGIGYLTPSSLPLPILNPNVNYRNREKLANQAKAIENRRIDNILRREARNES